jgi:peptide-methionine (S)-S-oxide reductase
VTKAIVLILAALGVTGAAIAGFTFPDPPKAEAPGATSKIVLAGGCFWGMQGVYEHVKGVVSTVVGYDGGKKDTAHYERIEEGDTNHAESVEVTFDPKIISLGEIYKIYFSAAHDPTTVNRQHNDVGTQYRSAIFYNDPSQKQLAETYIKQLNDAHVFSHPIVTQVVPNNGFFKAEDYHQHYLDQVVACGAKMNMHCMELNVGYIRGLDIPLLDEFKAKYPEYYTDTIK